jgi:hypothetical protein
VQTGRGLPEDDITSWWDDLDKLLSYSGALFNALYQLNFVSLDCYLGAEDQTAEELSNLGWELTREIRRRMHGLDRAGEIWKERAEAATTADSQKLHRKEG